MWDLLINTHLHNNDNMLNFGLPRMGYSGTGLDATSSGAEFMLEIESNMRKP